MKQTKFKNLTLLTFLILCANTQAFAASQNQVSIRGISNVIPSFVEIQTDLKERFENDTKLRTNNQMSSINIGTAFLNPDFEMNETDTHLVYKLIVPKMYRGRLNISLKPNGVIIIKNLQSEPTAHTTTQELVKERKYSRYQRVIRLPETVTHQGISPIERNGILEIKVQKI